MKRISGSLEATVRLIAEQAVRSGRFPAEVASYAEANTVSALAKGGAPVSMRRASAYFETVARRRVVRRYAGTCAAARVVLDAVVADMSSSGRSGPDIWDEILRGWGDHVPGEVVDEYRSKLCA